MHIQTNYTTTSFSKFDFWQKKMNIKLFIISLIDICDGGKKKVSCIFGIGTNFWDLLQISFAACALNNS